MCSFSGKDFALVHSMLVKFLGVVDLGGGQNSAFKHHYFCHPDRVASVRFKKKLNVVVLRTEHDSRHESPPDEARRKRCTVLLDELLTWWLGFTVADR